MHVGVIHIGGHVAAETCLAHLRENHRILTLLVQQLNQLALLGLPGPNLVIIAVSRYVIVHLGIAVTVHSGHCLDSVCHILGDFTPGGGRIQILLKFRRLVEQVRLVRIVVLIFEGDLVRLATAVHGLGTCFVVSRYHGPVARSHLGCVLAAGQLGTVVISMNQVVVKAHRGWVK